MTTIHEGQTFSSVFKVSPQQMEEYVRITGDQNPIHTDAAYAREQGFSAPVVYAGILTSIISTLMGMKFPGPGSVCHSLTIQYKAPLLVNEEAELRAKVTYANMDLGVVKLAIDIVRGETLIAQAVTQAGLLKTPPQQRH